ncbi:PcfJ domain-containing protein [Bacillus massiliglaciei]|uniref:PcfJ domain-containing protein n=1 Tax=Bacillus massiliglaciei TaxID=1816693 RepID=UPI000DA62D9E|nr:PcfJ domain-containing protein [Bacillus massiliglaciei]
MNNELEFQAHFSFEISDELKSYIINNALLNSRYFYVKRMTSTLQRGCCTHCKSNHTVLSDKILKHNEIWQCEKCHSKVIVKSVGRGRGKMVDRMYVVWYEKSLLDSQAITATGYYATLDYRTEMTGKLTILPVTRYLFELGKATMMHNDPESYRKGWNFASKPYSIVGKNIYTKYSEQSVESLKNAIKGTKFIYSQWEYYYEQNIDLVKFFSVFSKYPFVEYLIKMGMPRIVTNMVDGWSLYRSINHRGKTMNKILGLTKKEINDWKATNIEMTPALLSTYKWFKKRNSPVSWEIAKSCEGLITGGYYKQRFAQLQNHLSTERIVRYANNQVKKDSTRYRNILNVIISWTDYLEQCNELGLNIKEEKTLTPNSLFNAHQKTIRKMKFKKDKIINQKIASLQPGLKKFNFQYGNLFIRPAVSSLELFDEGKYLLHCVGDYAKRYSEGGITILLIRKKENPNTPYFTVEVDLSLNKVIQCHGYDNANPNDEVKSFLVAFNQDILAKMKKGRKLAI